MQSYFFVRDGRRYFKVKFANICYIEAVGNYVRITIPHKSFLIATTLKMCVQILPEGQFAKISRSCVIGFDYLESFDSDSVVVHGEKFSFSESCRTNFHRRFMVLGSQKIGTYVPDVRVNVDMLN